MTEKLSAIGDSAREAAPGLSGTGTSAGEAGQQKYARRYSAPMSVLMSLIAASMRLSIVAPLVFRS